MTGDRSIWNTLQRAIAWGSASVTQIANLQVNLAPFGDRQAQHLASPPPAPVNLVGRSTHLNALIDLMHPEADFRSDCLLITGPAGVGKTALALRFAEMVDRNSWFPGGILYVDFYGFGGGGRLTNAHALDILLRRFGICSSDIPEADLDRGRLYQAYMTRLAGTHERLLLIADNVDSEEQLKWLVPPPLPHRVVVTSRYNLPNIFGRIFELDVLDREAAAELVSATLNLARPEDNRTARQAEALGRIARQCGFLPLALQIVANILKFDPGLPLEHLADKLEDPSTRLDIISVGDEVGLVAAFGASYRRLSPEAAELFRRLSLNPGHHISTAACSALIEMSEQETRRHLAMLADAHLLAEVPVGSNRWWMHDLIRIYSSALQRELGDDREAGAVDRLLRAYSVAVVDADGALSPNLWGRNRQQSSRVKKAIEWMDQERLNLVPSVRLAASRGFADIAASLAGSLVEYLSLMRYTEDLLSVAGTAMTAAETSGDHATQLKARAVLLFALVKSGKYSEATSIARKQVALCREAGERGKEGEALILLGDALMEMARYDEAVDACREAWSLYRELGDVIGECWALDKMGSAFQRKTLFQEAVNAHKMQLARYREVGDRWGWAYSSVSLGVSLREQGRVPEAVAAMREGIDGLLSIGDKQTAGRALIQLSQTSGARDAIAECGEARRLFSEVGDRQGEADTVAAMVMPLLRRWRIRRARLALEEALQMFNDTGNVRDAGLTELRLAALYMLTGRLALAGETVRRALEKLPAPEDISEAMYVLATIGHFYCVMRRSKKALAALVPAAEALRALGDHHTGQTLLNLGIVYKRQGRLAEAATALRDASCMLREIGDPVSAVVALGRLRATLSKSGQWREAEVAHREMISIVSGTPLRAQVRSSWKAGTRNAGCRPDDNG